MQNTFNEYKLNQMNQNLGELDAKMSRLESMILLLVERIPTTTTTTMNPNNNNTK